MMSFNRTNLVQGAALALLFLDGPKVATSCTCLQKEPEPPAGTHRRTRARKGLVRDGQQVLELAPRAWHNELEHSNRSHLDLVTIIDRSTSFGNVLREVDEDLTKPYFRDPSQLYGDKEELIKDVLKCIELDHDRYNEAGVIQSNCPNQFWEHSVAETLGKLDAKELRKKFEHVITGDDDEDVATIQETSKFFGIRGSAKSYIPKLFVHEKTQSVHELVGLTDFKCGYDGKHSVLTFYTASGFDENYKRGWYKSYKVVFLPKEIDGWWHIRMFYRVSEGRPGKCELKFLKPSEYETLFKSGSWV